MTAVIEEYGIIKTANRMVEELLATDLCEVSDEEDLAFYTPINIDQRGPKVIISGIALAEGKFKTIFYPYSEIKKSVQRLKEKRYIVEHGLSIRWKNKIIGKIFKVEANDMLRAALFKAEITEPELAKEVLEGKWKGNSVRVLYDEALSAEHGKVAVNLDYENISLTDTPACKGCIIIQKELKEKLHELSDNSEIIDTDADYAQWKRGISDNSSTGTFTYIPTETVGKVEEMAEWPAKKINTFPNSSFAVVEGDYASGKCKNKSARHLPYKDANGKVDLPHLRNALARANQIKPVCGPESAGTLRTKAKKRLIGAAKRAGVGDYSEGSELSDKGDKLVEKINGLIKGEGSEETKLLAIQSAIENERLDKMSTPDMFRAIVSRIDKTDVRLQQIEEGMQTKDKDEDKEEGEGENPQKKDKSEDCSDCGEDLEDKDKDSEQEKEDKKVDKSKEDKEKDKKDKKEEKDEKKDKKDKKDEKDKKEDKKDKKEDKKEEKIEKPDPPKEKVEDVIDDPKTPPPVVPKVKEEPVDLEKFKASALLVEAHRPKIKEDERSRIWGDPKDKKKE